MRAARGDGAVYRCSLQGGQSDTAGAPIASEWVAVDMAAVLTGVALAAPDAWGNQASEDAISGPDNLSFAPAWRTLFIGEDTGRHASNFLWAWRLDTGKLTRVLAAPEGAEVTGLFPFVVGQRGYLTVHFQHPGAYVATPGAAGAAVAKAIDAAWGGKKQAGMGYLSGLPGLGP